MAAPEVPARMQAPPVYLAYTEAQEAALPLLEPPAGAGAEPVEKAVKMEPLHRSGLI